MKIDRRHLVPPALLLGLLAFVSAFAQSAAINKRGQAPLNLTTTL
jgi:hypothetical protein